MGWVLFAQILILLIILAIAIGSVISTYWDRKALYYASTRSPKSTL